MTPLEAALRYAEIGLTPFAVHGMRRGVCTCGAADCKNAGKHPTTRHGLKDASRDPAVIRVAWHRDAGFNVAVRTGPESGFWVWDLDGPEAEAARERLEAEHGALPVTVEQATGRGRHICFAWDDRFPLRNMSRRSRALIGADTDIRGAGGYIIVGPSIHKSGRRYDWTPGRSPFDIPFAPAPEWLLQLLAPEPEPAPRPVAAPSPRRHDGRATAYGEKALDAAVATIRSARVGARDTTLYRECCVVACLVAGGEIDEGYARSTLIDVGRVHVPDAMSERQLLRQVDRALAWGSTRAWRPERRGYEPRSRQPLGAIHERLWDESRPAGQAVAAYLRALSIHGGPLDHAMRALRFHPAAYWGEDVVAPAIVARIVSPASDGRPRPTGGVVAIYLSTDGGDLAPLAPPGRIWGPRMGPDRRPGGVWLNGPAGEGPLIVAVTLEAALAAGVLYGEPCRLAAALSDRGLEGGLVTDQWGRANPDAPQADPDVPAFTWPGMDGVMVAVDGRLGPLDMKVRAPLGGTVRRRLEGEARARICAGLASQHWRRAGATRVSAIAPPAGLDFNDWLREGLAA